MINQLENLKRKAYWNLPLRDFLRHHSGYYLPPKNNFTVKFGRVCVSFLQTNYPRK